MNFELRDSKRFDFGGDLVSISKKEDKMMRVSSLHYVAYSANDGMFKLFQDLSMETVLMQQCVDNQYTNRRMSDLRSSEQSFWHRFIRNVYAERWYNLKGHRATVTWSLRFELIGVFGITWIFGPIYIISRVIAFCYPLLILCCLYFNGIGLFDFDPFQLIMMAIYILLEMVVIILFCVNVSEQYLMYHILWSYSLLPRVGSNDVSTEIQRITKHYMSVRTLVMRKSFIFDQFGMDIGTIILSYLSAFDQIDNYNADIMLATTI